MPVDVLQGWKSIATYLDRDERTVRRWEKQRALPVRRLAGGGRGVVYALPDELDRWLQATPPPAPTTPGTDDAETPPTPTLTIPTIAPDEAGLVTRAAERQAPATAAPDDLPAPPATWRLNVPPPAVRLRQQPWPWALAASAAILLLVPALRHATVAAGGRQAEAAVRPVDQRVLRGEFFWEQRSPAALQLALQAFEEATRQNPADAAAWAGVAKTYCLLRQYSTVPSDRAFPLAEQAARRALQLDETLPEAHAVLGFVLFFWDWQPAAAQQHFERALQLNPASALAHHWYGSMLTHQGRTAQALAHLDAAQKLQPTSPAILVVKAYALATAQRRDEAVALLRQVEESNPTLALPHRVLAAISMQAPRDMHQHLVELRRAAELDHQQQLAARLDAAQAVLRRSGEAAMWRGLLAAEAEQAGPQPSIALAQMEAAAGLPDAALAHLEALRDQHDPLLSGLMLDPHFAALRDTPRFQQLLRSIGLQTRVEALSTS